MKIKLLALTLILIALSYFMPNECRAKMQVVKIAPAGELDIDSM